MKKTMFMTLAIAAVVALFASQAAKADLDLSTGVYEGWTATFEGDYTVEKVKTLPEGGWPNSNVWRPISVDGVDSKAEWIVPIMEEGTWGDFGTSSFYLPGGDYTFSVTFEAFNGQALQAFFLADNNFKQVTLNDNVLNVADGETALHDSRIPGSFNFEFTENGTYTLAFVIENTNGHLTKENPAGLIAYVKVTGAGIESTPTPEPATLAILGFGLIGAGFAARRRK